MFKKQKALSVFLKVMVTRGNFIGGGGGGGGILYLVKLAVFAWVADCLLVSNTG